MDGITWKKKNTEVLSGVKRTTGWLIFYKTNKIAEMSREEARNAFRTAALVEYGQTGGRPPLGRHRRGRLE